MTLLKDRWKKAHMRLAKAERNAYYQDQTETIKYLKNQIKELEKEMEQK